MRGRPVVQALGVGLAIVAVAAACGSDPEPTSRAAATSTSSAGSPSTGAQGQLGKPVQITDSSSGAARTATVTVDKPVSPEMAGDHSMSQNGTFADFFVTVTAGPKGYAIDPSAFYVRQSDGSQQKSRQGHSTGLRQTYTKQALTAGKKVTGYVPFDIDALDGSALVLAPGGKPVAEWKLG